MNKGGFSWKKLTGVSNAKSKISRTIGVPLTKSGRQQKLGKMVSGGGCLIWIVIGAFVLIFVSVSIAFEHNNNAANNPGAQAAWKTAAHVELPPKKKDPPTP